MKELRELPIVDNFKDKLDLEERVARLKLLHDELKLSRDIIKLSKELSTLQDT